MSVLFLSTLLVGLLKMIYISPRPYWSNLEIVPYGSCETGWGNPSGHSLTCVAVYLTLWHIIFECHQLREKVIEKYVSLGFTIIFIMLIMISRVIVGAHSLNQILYGASLGFCVYFFFFFVLCVDLNNPKQFIKIIEFRTLISLVINFFILIFAFLLFVLTHDSENSKAYDEVINSTICKGAPLGKRLQNEGFLAIAVFLVNLAALIGLKLEFYFFFNGNYENWKQYNFEEEEKFDDSKSLLSKISINKSTQWNHTGPVKSFLRLILVALLAAVPMLMYILIPYSVNIYIQFIFKVFASLTITVFGLFYLYKPVLRKVKLVNSALFTELLESM